VTLASWAGYTMLPAHRELTVDWEDRPLRMSWPGHGIRVLPNAEHLTKRQTGLLAVIGSGALRLRSHAWQPYHLMHGLQAFLDPTSTWGLYVPISRRPGTEKWV
jgi:hypothetical protein